jgi:Flp pilus assembly protein TadD
MTLLARFSKERVIRRVLVVICLLLVTALLPSPAEAASAEVVFSTASGAVVIVEARDADGSVRTLGSGVAVAPGLIVTNFHVVRNGKSIVVRQAGKKQSASIAASDARRDLSLLRLKETRLSPVGMRASSSLRVGERVYAIGAPEGLELSLSEGVVSALRPVVDGSYIQTSAAISHGSSGGGLFDSSGRLIGITTFTIVKGQNLNFAIPTDWITALLDGVAAPPTGGGSASSGISSTVQASAETSAEDAYRTASELFLLASKQLRPGNEAEAMETALDALRICPSFGPAWSTIAAIQLGLGNLPEALKSAQEGVRLSPNFWGTWHALYYALDRIGRLDDAERALSEALKLNPSEPALLRSGADLSVDRQDYASAVAKYRNLISVSPQDDDSWLGLGKAQEGRGNKVEARTAFNEAIRIKPDKVTAWVALGFNYVQDGRPADAVEPYRRASKLDPDWVVPCKGLCGALNNADRLKEALPQCRTCVAKFPSDAQALYGLGVVYYRLGDREALLDTHERLHKLDSNRADELFRCCIERR